METVEEVRGTAPEKSVRWGIVILRITMGMVFLVNGLHRLLFFDYHRGIDLIERAANRSPTLDGALVAITVTLSGAALVVGLGTRIASAILILDVLLGVWAVDVNAASFLPAGGRFALVLLGATAAIAISGSGGFALESLFVSKRRRMQDLDVAVRLEPRGNKLARCIVTVRERVSGKRSQSSAETWHGRLES